ncbi:hypothetical protein BDZ45DRAFT_328743 [Acephala macrosclerotiorum]|nr:hypothetical protein BDZ45DRAFT_328743 [Acephala macrosclerotiorum]
MCILLQYIYHDCGCLAKTGTYHCRDARIADREWSADCPRYKKTEQVLRIGELTCNIHVGLVLREGTPEPEFAGLESGESGGSTELGEGENGFDLKKLKEKLKAIKEKREARREAERVKAEQLRAKICEGVEEGKGKEVELKDDENIKTTEGGPEDAFASSSSSSDGSDSDEMGYEGDTEDPVKKPIPVAKGTPSPAALAGSLSPRAFAASLGPRPASNPLSLGLRRITGIEGLKEVGSPTKKASLPPPLAPPPPPKDDTST